LSLYNVVIGEYQDVSSDLNTLFYDGKEVKLYSVFCFFFHCLSHLCPSILLILFCLWCVIPCRKKVL